MSKLTKIIATIGPATETEEVMEALINAGMNVARFTPNMVHQLALERIHRVKSVAKRLNKSVGVLLDLQGPEFALIPKTVNLSLCKLVKLQNL
jgi:pyruvate kinase